ncbi:MAG: hypothetical protein OEV94_06325 [Deltaproteobacteria bacterium]|nr:hypothetical protein [Deltaproteobacteria bacterium]
MMKTVSFKSVVLKTTVLHTGTYLIIGGLAYLLLDYPRKYADPSVAIFMRQTSDPWVQAGILFQPVRGFLLGCVFYALRDVIFSRKDGWLRLWAMLVIVGVITPFGPAPSSIEGVVYTNLPLWFHLMALPEIFIQTLLLSFLTHVWVNRSR